MHMKKSVLQFFFTACWAFTFCAVDDSTQTKTTLNYFQYIQQHVVQSQNSFWNTEPPPFSSNFIFYICMSLLIFLDLLSFESLPFSFLLQIKKKAIKIIQQPVYILDNIKVTV